MIKPPFTAHEVAKAAVAKDAGVLRRVIDARKRRNQMITEIPEALEPIVTLGWDKAEDGTYKAVMTVSGLRSEHQAKAAISHMQLLFCGSQQGAKND